MDMEEVIRLKEKTPPRQGKDVLLKVNIVVSLKIVDVFLNEFTKLLSSLGSG